MLRYLSKRHWATPLKRCLATNIATEHDVVIVGGGLMGCSTAYHLISHDPSLRVCIVERDPSVSCNITTVKLHHVDYHLCKCA